MDINKANHSGFVYMRGRVYCHDYSRTNYSTALQNASVNQLATPPPTPLYVDNQASIFIAKIQHQHEGENSSNLGTTFYELTFTSTIKRYARRPVNQAADKSHIRPSQAAYLHRTATQMPPADDVTDANPLCKQEVCHYACIARARI